MKYHIPYYYQSFACIGGECEDTCCGGWNIAIDDESMEAYLHTPGAFGKRLLAGVDPERGCFRQKNRHCIFWNREGLCDIYKELGKEAMCRDCRTYPRHMEDYGMLREISLSLSCPEAARVILGDPRQGAFRSKTRESGQDSSKYQKAPWTDLSWILQARRTMMKLVENRELSWQQRLAMTAAYAHDLQNHWYAVQAEEGDEVQSRRMELEERKLSNRYLAEAAAGRFAEKLKKYEDRPFEHRVRINAWMREAEDLEPVLDHWGEKQRRICKKLYHELGMQDYRNLEAAFEKETKKLEPEWENLALYFLQVYVPGALYDGDLYDKVQLALFCCVLIREWCLYRFACTGVLDREIMVAAAYRCSREIENSDANLENLETMFLENPLFELDSILTVLCGGGSGR